MTKKATKKKRKAYDWETIEKEYRVGQMSVSEIARQHGCSHTAIQKKAKLNGWTRDLTDKVRREIKQRLISEEVAKNRDAATFEKEAIETAADRGLAVIKKHQAIVRDAYDVADALIALSKGNKDANTLCNIFRSLTQGLEKVIERERQIYGLDEVQADTDAKDRKWEIVFRDADGVTQKD